MGLWDPASRHLYVKEEWHEVYAVVRVTQPGSGTIVIAGLSGQAAHDIVQPDRGDCVVSHARLRYPNGGVLDTDDAALVGQEVVLSD